MLPTYLHLAGHRYVLATDDWRAKALALIEQAGKGAVATGRQRDLHRLSAREYAAVVQALRSCYTAVKQAVDVPAALQALQQARLVVTTGPEMRLLSMAQHTLTGVFG